MAQLIYSALHSSRLHISISRQKKRVQHLQYCHGIQEIMQAQGRSQVNNRSFLCGKLIMVGIFLPMLDLATDVSAIYKHWTSNQWTLQYLAKGLMLCMAIHNMIAGWYSWSVHLNGSTQVKWSFHRQMVYCLCCALGIRNVQITVEILVLLRNKRLVSR